MSDRCMWRFAGSAVTAAALLLIACGTSNTPSGQTSPTPTPSGTLDSNDSPITVADGTITLQPMNPATYTITVTSHECTIDLGNYKSHQIDMDDSTSTVQETHNLDKKTWSIKAYDARSTMLKEDSGKLVLKSAAPITAIKDASSKIIGCKAEVDFMPANKPATLTVIKSNEDIDYPSGLACIHYCPNGTCTPSLLPCSHP